MSSAFILHPCLPLFLSYASAIIASSEMSFLIKPSFINH